MKAGVAHPEGRLAIRLSPARHTVDIRSSRPLQAARLFEGKTTLETLTLIPVLFNVCGQSQSLAAIRAIESASGHQATASTERPRDRLLQLENLREHLWRILLEWPQFHGEAQASDALKDFLVSIREIRRCIDPRGRLLTQPGAAHSDCDPARCDELTRKLRDALAIRLFDTDLQAWLAFDSADLENWVTGRDTPLTRLLRFVRERGWERLGPTAIPALPPLPAAELLQQLDGSNADEFIARPLWHGEPWETGPLARHNRHPLLVVLQERHGLGLLVRLIARLVEVATIAVQLSTRQPSAEPYPAATGLSQLEAARGRLCHRVVLDGDRIARYRILAPTEWNFHPDGVAARALLGIADRPCKDAELQANLLIHAIDPCVGYQLHWEAA